MKSVKSDASEAKPSALENLLGSDHVQTTPTSRSKPILNQRGPEVQRFGERFEVPNGLENETCNKSVSALNQVLADTMFLRDMYKKHHWQVAGPTFYQLHLLLDKHYQEQAELMDTIAERIQALGGISLAMPADIAAATKIEQPPKGREAVPVQLSRLLEAHEIILKESRTYAKQADEDGDDGTNDLLISEVVRTNELQSWFLAEHLVALPVLPVSDSSSVLKN